MTDQLSQAVHLYQHGISQAEKGDLESAIFDWTHAIFLHPEFPDAFEHRGMALREKGNLDASIIDLSEAIRLRPQKASTHYRRGRVREERKDVDGAIEDFAKTIELNPNDARPYSRRGALYSSKGDSERSLADLTAALRINPEDGNACYHRASIFVQQGKNEAAIPDIVKFLQKYPNHPEAAEWRRLLTGFQQGVSMGAYVGVPVQAQVTVPAEMGAAVEIPLPAQPQPAWQGAAQPAYAAQPGWQPVPQAAQPGWQPVPQAAQPGWQPVPQAAPPVWQVASQAPPPPVWQVAPQAPQPQAPQPQAPQPPTLQPQTSQPAQPSSSWSGAAAPGQPQAFGAYQPSATVLNEAHWQAAPAPAPEPGIHMDPRSDPRLDQRRPAPYAIRRLSHGQPPVEVEVAAQTLARFAFNVCGAAERVVGNEKMLWGLLSRTVSEECWSVQIEDIREPGANGLGGGFTAILDLHQQMRTILTVRPIGPEQFVAQVMVGRNANDARSKATQWDIRLQQVLPARTDDLERWLHSLVQQGALMLQENRLYYAGM